MTRNTAHMRMRARQREIREHYPHRIGLPHLYCTDPNFDIINRFCKDHFGDYPKTEIIYGRWEGFDGVEEMRLYCFASPEQASEFCTFFEGVPFDERACRKTGKDRRVWLMPGPPTCRVRHGPLVVPKWLKEHP
jgi:hypothetical protein